MKMTTMKLMMMMTPSEEVDEVSFDPTASGRLFSAVQNIIGRSDRDIQLWSQPQRQSLESLLAQRKRRRSAKVVTTPARRRWNRAVKLVRLMVMSVRWWLMWLVVRLTGLVMMLVRCWWIKGISFLYAPNVILLKYLALSPKRFSSEVTPGKSSTLTRFLQNERFVTGDTELQNVRAWTRLGHLGLFCLPCLPFCQVLPFVRYSAITGTWQVDECKVICDIFFMWRLSVFAVCANNLSRWR